MVAHTPPTASSATIVSLLVAYAQCYCWKDNNCYTISSQRPKNRQDLCDIGFPKAGWHNLRHVLTNGFDPKFVIKVRMLRFLVLTSSMLACNNLSQFVPACPRDFIQVPNKEWHVERLNLRADSKNLAKQNDGVDIWFMRFHFRASIKPIFENCKF